MANRVNKNAYMEKDKITIFCKDDPNGTFCLENVTRDDGGYNYECISTDGKVQLIETTDRIGEKEDISYTRVQVSDASWAMLTRERSNEGEKSKTTSILFSLKVIDKSRLSEFEVVKQQ